MALSFGAKSNVDKISKAFGDMASRQIPFATSVALNRTARRSRDELRSQLGKVFDRPTNYT